jgi:ABC-2 type transport system ATP-binding protein
LQHAARDLIAQGAGDVSMPALIQAIDLQKSFGSIRAVDKISLSVPKGEVLGFLGPNGAGKSTTMKLITGFLEPDAGTALIAGLDVARHPKLAKARLGYVPEGAPAYGDMTTAGFLKFIGEVRGYRGDDLSKRVDAAVAKTELGDVLGQRIETLSKGFKRRVGLAQAILHDPEVLIMDEPTDGLDPNQKHQVRKLIRTMAAEKAIIVSTHILEEVEAVCTRAVVINKGRIVADGTAETLMRRAPDHGAVAIRVPAAAAAEVSALLTGRGGIARVETLAIDGASARLKALPKNGAAIATEVADALRAKGVAVEELTVERGKLDDVFRQITVSQSS